MNDTPDSYQTTDLAQRRERGIAAYARIFDAPEEDLPAAMARLVGPLFAEEVFLAAGGPAWYHPAITDRERHLVIITALAAQGVVDSDRLDSHIQQALRAGVDYESLAAMMTLVTNYIGQAYGSQAMQAVQRVATQTRRRQRQTSDRDHRPTET